MLKLQAEYKLGKKVAPEFGRLEHSALGAKPELSAFSTALAALSEGGRRVQWASKRHLRDALNEQGRGGRSAVVGQPEQGDRVPRKDLTGHFQQLDDSHPRKRGQPRKSSLHNPAPEPLSPELKADVPVVTAERVSQGRFREKAEEFPEEEEEDESSSEGYNIGGSVKSYGLEKDHFSSDEAIEADNEDEVEPCDDDSKNAAESSAATNSSWADAMAKILNKKTPKSKPTILVKNKKLEKEKEKLKQERLEKRAQLDKKREWEMMCRVKPDVVRDKETERNLQRIATRGVVQLFNAVQKHQKNVDEKVKAAGGSVRKRAKLISTVSKKDFISVLRGMDGEKSSPGKNPKAKQSTEEAEEGPGWTILRDDFMMGASMKDWDKDSDGPDHS
ncbi:RRP15-like protein [Galemys pyrenaicus]|uniref:RRP15-like protein n=1 Tax=Galemys pyrenaicus TaxID=202257 RepID=A0A8J6DRN9_GALPY|nr:RRP15-like protein [Galemys pyrenaicus]